MIFVARQAEERVAFTFLFMKEIRLEDNYLWAFDATVDEVFDDRVILDKTAFYPQSGGQPSDLGCILRGDEQFQVVGVEPRESGIKHIISIINKRLAVTTRILPRAEALVLPDLVRLAMDVPDREMIRMVEIESVDRQACGGTHVKNSGEIGKIMMIKAENKGKANRRVYFSLED
jgi:Ser-tRNA(Ala) deacylase AlaX